MIGLSDKENSSEKNGRLPSRDDDYYLQGYPTVDLSPSNSDSTDSGDDPAGSGRGIYPRRNENIAGRSNLLWIKTLLSILLILTGLSFVVMGGLLCKNTYEAYVSDKAFVGKADEVEATIDFINIYDEKIQQSVRTNKSSVTRYSAVFSYNYKGKKYKKTFSQISTSVARKLGVDSRDNVGKKVILLVDPDKPEDVRIEFASRSYSSFAFIVIFAGAGCIIGGIIFLIHIIKKYRKAK